MSLQLISSFMAVKTGSPISKLLLLKLAHNADGHGICFPSCEYLALHCETSLRTVKSHLKILEQNGFLSRIQRFDKKGRQRSNLYQLRIPDNCHIEQDHSYTREGDKLALTESAHSAHIKDQIEKDLQEVCKSAPITPPQPHPQQQQPKQVVIYLPSQEGDWPIYQEFYQLLQQSYPSVNVLEQLNAMRAWLYVNQDKRKPVEQLGHFVNGWLRRKANAEQNRKSYLQQHSTHSGSIRAADRIIEEYRQSGHKHSIEDHIQNMLQQHKSRK
ncbi:helix-turn-helix domain-containing protein [Vibrio ziniensis]|uniref:Helix-turn-helix domain-containing protein n=1 Tax=Vibrio ziniensis TaxID=2711221 RepID=A0A6G7CLK4_9VIBR|nr:helix-turn-helix domain-containing protein [Vibrio ziniensis]QIH42982.1 helix-turn-helix domain-containing protein [Vibrio ziniensis]